MITGGRDSGGYKRSVEIFSPVTKESCSLPPLPEPGNSGGLFYHVHILVCPALNLSILIPECLLASSTFQCEPCSQILVWKPCPHCVASWLFGEEVGLTSLQILVN